MTIFLRARLFSLTFKIEIISAVYSERGHWSIIYFTWNNGIAYYVCVIINWQWLIMKYFKIKEFSRCTAA